MGRPPPGLKPWVAKRPDDPVNSAFSVVASEPLYTLLVGMSDGVYRISEELAMISDMKYDNVYRQLKILYGLDLIEWKPRLKQNGIRVRAYTLSAKGAGLAAEIERIRAFIEREIQ